MTGASVAWLVLCVPLLPLLLAALGAFPALRRYLPALAIATPLPALAAALLTAGEVKVRVPWLLLDTRLGLDDTGRAFLTLFALLWLLAAWHAAVYLRKDLRRGRFAVLFLLAMAGSLGTAVAQDALSFYAAFALMSFASYGLVVHDGAPESLRAGRVYIVLVVIGELALFSGIVLAVAAAGTGFGGGRAAIPSLALLLLALGFGIKAGLVPLHVWLPLAHPAAPVPASAVLSGAMIKVGLLGALRFFPFPGQPGMGEVLVVLGAASALYGVAVGVLQTNPKALLAYSSISQMGLIAIGLGLALAAPDTDLAGAAVAATLVLALHHGLAKAALFLGTALAPGSVRGTAWGLRLLGLALPAAALAAAPLTSGAIAKSAVKALEGGPAWLDLFLSLSSAATTLLLVRFLSLMSSKGGEEKPGIVMPWAACVAASALGLWLLPQGNVYLGYNFSRSAVLDSLWPVLLGAALGGVVAWLLRSKDEPAVPPGDLLSLARPLAALGPSLMAAARGAARLIRSDPAASVLALGIRLRRVEEGAQSWTVGAALAGVVTFLLFVSLLRP